MLNILSMSGLRAGRNVARNVGGLIRFICTTTVHHEGDQHFDSVLGDVGSPPLPVKLCMQH